ncbi:hypothetical protein HPP92_027919 [Vanilla planifolia]|uniref:Uncharacterized protein n=1 Tax=Vanilla planifolia TaxID=51239 RepID=A0A835U3J9_VANPL|nr:hypothetical protein HPP92_027919 [Vanilla planifolia]
MATFPTTAGHLYGIRRRHVGYPSPKPTHPSCPLSSSSKVVRRPPVAAGVLGIIGEASTRLLDAVVSSNFKFTGQPWLPSQSNFMPVEENGDAELIGGIEGEISQDFPEGVYIRNGPNPLVGALQSASSVLGLSSETWLEGEGMLHSITFSKSGGGSGGGCGGNGWTVSYRNRFVESETLRIERGRRSPAFLPVIEGDAPAVVAAYLLNQLRFGKAIKDLSNTNVFELSGRAFSITENHLPHEIDLSSLETLGTWDLNGAWNRSFMAHPRKAPGGELVFVGADAMKPFLVLGVISADGKELKHKVDLKLERGIICHDIGVTKRYNIILDMPLTFDLIRLVKGGPLIKFEKESHARIGVMPRYGDADSIKWFEVEPFCSLHIVNCYEDGDEVVIRAGRSRGSIIPGPEFKRNRYQWFSNGFKIQLTDESYDDNSNEGLFVTRIHEWTLNMKTSNVKQRYLTGSDLSVEMPMINDLYGGLCNRYAYAQLVDSEASSICALPKFGSLVKFYFNEEKENKMKLENTCCKYIEMERHQLGANNFCSGATFVPKQGDVKEDDGWVITFVHDEDTNTSQVHIIDAKNFEGDPIAKITLPRRVPYGFHGTFIPRLRTP